jgi:Transposase
MRDRAWKGAQRICETPERMKQIGRMRMRKSQFSEEQIIGILRLAEAGQTVAEVCRQQGISEGT